MVEVLHQVSRVFPPLFDDDAIARDLDVKDLDDVIVVVLSILDYYHLLQLNCLHHQVMERP